MPTELAKPFKVPTQDQVLRFRYTTYMGEFHPAEKKVVVEFSPADLGLTPVQADKLRKLAGPRYNPTKDVVKMSCESFGQPAQNKRYLSDLVDTLITEAKVRCPRGGALPLSFSLYTSMDGVLTNALDV